MVCLYACLCLPFYHSLSLLAFFNLLRWFLVCHFLSVSNVCLFVCLYPCRSICLSFHLFTVCQCFYLSISLSDVPVCLFVIMPACLSVCLSVCLILGIYMYVNDLIPYYLYHIHIISVCLMLGSIFQCLYL